jgi:hypothetical protein
MVRAICRALGVIYALVALFLLGDILVAWSMGPGREERNIILDVYMWILIAMWMPGIVVPALIAYGFLTLRWWVRWAVTLVNAPFAIFWGWALIGLLLTHPERLYEPVGLVAGSMSIPLAAIVGFCWHPAVKRVMSY